MGRLTVGRKSGEAVVLFLPDGRSIRISAQPRNFRGVLVMSIEAPDDVRIVREELLTKDQPHGPPRNPQVQK